MTRAGRTVRRSGADDQMIKYATVIRTRTASTEAILCRFTRNASHPTHAAMLEVGRAQKDHLRGPLPAASGPPAGDRGGPERDGVLQRRELRDRLRQGRGDRLEPARRAGDVRVVPADSAIGPGLREHPDAPGHSR
ncbi:hypothetical protein FAGKG844_10047 [Frankia sp. AgKG'84/4]